MATGRQVRLVKPNWSSGPKSAGDKSDPEREVLKEAEGQGGVAAGRGRTCNLDTDTKAPGVGSEPATFSL